MAIYYIKDHPNSKKPPVITGGIALFRLCLSAFGGYFHPPVETGGIEIGTIKIKEERTAMSEEACSYL